MTQERPDPDLLVARAEKEALAEKRGKLKIYLGASPGVGKTYAMLRDALSERAQGLDVVVGIAESHGRSEIERFLTGLESLPQASIPYRDKVLFEFDLDAALKRHPGLILIDEMAHTNVPGLRHAKRWQDIKEILDSGIDVYTTLNVQHIESLNDIIAKVTKIQVKETVPDSMLELANTIELVDLAPEDLLKRLQEGKIYLPKQVELAKENYFSKGNLIALRELALRQTAARVESEILLYRKDQGIKQIWATHEKILVCVGSDTESIKLIRAARRIATDRQVGGLKKVEWIAVHVETPSIRLLEWQRNNIVQNLRLAEQLGAKTHILTGFDIVKEIMNFARDQNITQIVLRKKIRPRWREFLFHGLADEIIRNSGDIDIYIITGDLHADSHVQKKYFEKPEFPWKLYAIVTGMIGFTTGIGFFLYPILKTSGVIMLYFLTMTIVALFGSVGSSLFASFLSVAIFDFFFIPPFYSFSVADSQYIFVLLLMLSVSQIINNLIIRAHQQLESARHAENHTAALHAFSKELAASRGLDALLTVGIKHLSEIFNSRVLVLLPEANQLVVYGKNKIILSDKDKAIAQWVYDLGQPAGLGTETLSVAADAIYVPMLVANGALGVLRVAPLQVDNLLTPEQMLLLEDCANQLALVLEVDHLQESSKKLALKTEADRMRTLFLQAIANDLSVPSKVVMEAANMLMEGGSRLDGSEIKKIGENIYSELKQLSQLNDSILQSRYLGTKPKK